jgi:hypothetical protein
MPDEIGFRGFRRFSGFRRFRGFRRFEGETQLHPMRE